MKILEETDDYLIIQCQRFDAGREPINLPKPKIGDIPYIVSFTILGCLSGASFIDNFETIVLNFKTYWNTHQLQSIFYSLAGIVFAESFIHNLFFKKAITRDERTYKIERDGKFSLDRPSKYELYERITMMVEDAPPPKTIDKIDFFDKIEIDEMSDRETEVPILRAYSEYRVIFTFESGQALPIESNCLIVTSGNENQAALRQLISDTESVVERIKNFLSRPEANQEPYGCTSNNRPLA